MAGRIKHGTVNGTVVVELTGDYSSVEILNRNGAAEIWIKMDDSSGDTLTPEADDLDVIPAAIGSIVLESTATGSTVVKLHSTTNCKYSVKGLV